MMKKSIRVEKLNRKRLRSVRDNRSKSAPKPVSSAAENRARGLFWKQVNWEFRLLRMDPSAWKHELEERSAWDAMLCDCRK